MYDASEMLIVKNIIWHRCSWLLNAQDKDHLPVREDKVCPDCHSLKKNVLYKRTWRQGWTEPTTSKSIRNDMIPRAELESKAKTPQEENKRLKKNVQRRDLKISVSFPV